MAESAALLVEDILPGAPIRQWILSFPYALRILYATCPTVMGEVLGIVYRTLATHQARSAGHTHRTDRTGAVTLIQRFGSALNLNIHFHMLLLDGMYTRGHDAHRPDARNIYRHRLNRKNWRKIPGIDTGCQTISSFLLGSWH